MREVAQQANDALVETTIIAAVGKKDITSFCDGLADGIDQLMQAERLYQWAKPEESAGALCALMMSCVVHRYVPVPRSLHARRHRFVARACARLPPLV